MQLPAVMLRRTKCTFLGAIASLTLAAQVPNPTQQQQPPPAPEQIEPRADLSRRSGRAHHASRQLPASRRRRPTSISRAPRIDATGQRARQSRKRARRHPRFGRFQEPGAAVQLRAGISDLCSVGDLARRPSRQSGRADAERLGQRIDAAKSKPPAIFRPSA